MAAVSFFVSMPAISFLGCGAVPVATRYGEKKPIPENVPLKEKISENVIEEDFDFSNFQHNIIVESKPTAKVKSVNSNVWFNYDETDKARTYKKEKGFRVQVVTTDIFEEADSVRAGLYFKTYQRAMYIDFDPPFYKLKIGDFLDINAAKELNFKLNQLGYHNSLVIPDSVNVIN
ncbi:MAG: hypothetical protein C0425_00515 [Chlorobiaceae bacterium]|nr:hypothetical protein [Chlorobiaceae bacterium]MBA4308806.1 hypothetical protein [Chlorobiaceae bacterium]